MASAIDATTITFKDFVNEGKVPEDTFVVSKQQVCACMCVCVAGRAHQQGAARALCGPRMRLRVV
jgi:hypothetical protein